MLELFEVTNFKGFKSKLSFDFRARDYVYNPSIVKNGLVNKALIYGKNGSGKTNLTIALFDIISHLTDKERMPSRFTTNYNNLDSGSGESEFRYVFKFDDDKLDYRYSKKGYESLQKEELLLNGKPILKFDYFNRKDNFVDPAIIGDLNTKLLVDNKLSIIKYIYKNTPTDSVPVITKLVQFCEHMLWFQSLSDGNAYAGYSNGTNLLSEILFEQNKLGIFNEFLKENGLNYHLKFETVNGTHVLYAVFRHGEVPFESIISSGTRSLFLFFDWSLFFKDVSFLAIDEFDAFYHYESAEYIVRKLNEAANFQSVLTTHNTYLMQNKLTRPDCCYILSDNHISCLAQCTDKEIRQAHNLEKMYINGVFTND